MMYFSFFQALSEKVSLCNRIAENEIFFKIKFIS